MHVYYGQKEAIKGIDMQFEKNKITALIGPSGCGKSTFLRSLNRMNDTIDIAKVTGQVFIKESMLTQVISIFMKCVNILEWFSRPNPFKVYLQKYHLAPERKGVRDKQTLDEIVETSLKQAGLWDR
ncbi:MAG: ATP-binding cassette domain-containing protein [Streptococcus salivarius]